MALKKSIAKKSGAVSTYWRIVGHSFNELEKRFEIILAGWLTEGHRREVDAKGEPKFGHDAIAVQSIEAEQFAALFPGGGAEPPPLASQYEFLKTRPDWSGAENV